MSLKLYNTRTRTKDAFTPLDPSNVRMYVCGPTVYDYAHIGNARPVIVFDVLYRLLRHLYGESHVTYVRNITDVDDKINARAAERYPELPFNEAIRKLTDETAAQYHRDVAALGCLPPTHEPRATEYIAEMTTMIETLVDKGCAYIAEEHALFQVSAMADYGQLARRSLDEMRAGARIEVAPYKRDPMDFVLWKPSKEGEPSWPSPRGIMAPGRPGWHLECSAMAKALLGETFDIHGGGIDLVFPHHENEVAQSRCAHGTDIMANVWMHNGHLQVEGAKMSKSDGNFVTINDLTRSQLFGGQLWPGDVIRLAMLKSHYRQPIDWTVSLLHEAERNIEQLHGVRDRFDATHVHEPFIFALEDDLNTKVAIDILFDLAKEANKGDFDAGGKLVSCLNLLGFMVDPIVRLGPDFEVDELGNTFIDEEQLYEGMGRLLPENALLGVVRRRILDAQNDVPPEAKAMLQNLTRYADGGTPLGYILQYPERTKGINKSIEARHTARASKNWAEADRIRDELAAVGVALKDAKNPATGEIVTTWEIAR